MRLLLQFIDSFNIELCRYLKATKLFGKQKILYFKLIEDQSHILLVRYIVRDEDVICEKTYFNVLKVDKRGSGAPKNGNTISTFDVTNEKKPGVYCFSVDVNAFIQAINDKVGGIQTLEFLWDELKANLRVALKSSDCKYEQVLPLRMEEDPVQHCILASEKFLTFKNVDIAPQYHACEKLFKFQNDENARILFNVQQPCVDAEQDSMEVAKIQQKGPNEHFGVIHVTFNVKDVKIHDGVQQNIKQAMVQKHCKQLQKKIEYEASLKHVTPQQVAEALDLPWNCIKAEIDETDQILRHPRVQANRIHHTYHLNCLVPGRSLLSLLSYREDKAENALIINPAALTFTSKTQNGCKFKTIIQVAEITNDISIKE